MKPALYPKPMRGLLLWAVLLLLTVAMVGCTIPNGYVKADRMTYDGIGKEYLRYVYDDPHLTQKKRERRRALILSWEARLVEAETGEKEAAASE